MLFYLASLESTEEFVWTLRGGSSCAAFAFDSLYFTMIRYTLLYCSLWCLVEERLAKVKLAFGLVWGRRDRVISISCTALYFSILEFILYKTTLHGPLLLFLNVI